MDTKIEKRFEAVGRSTTFRNIVRAFDLGNKAVLDIGCSYGEHLAHFGKGSVGVTIVKEEALYGKTKGLDTRYGNIEDEAFVIPEKFDAIFCNNLLEHLYSPHAFLVKLRNYLKENGTLVLGVPCIPKIASLVAFTKFRGSLAEAHINFFTKETLTTTVERAGYRVRSIRGFHFSNPALDHLIDPVYPHFYAEALPIKDFRYTEKRMKELHGYDR